MPQHRPNATTILLLTALAAAALSACGGSSSSSSTPTATPATQPVTSAFTATGTAGPPGSSSSPATPPHGNKHIPQLAGDTLSVAELYLQQAGLRAGHTLQEANTAYQSGLVITTSPWAGDMVPSGYPVDLLVSTGSPGCQGPSCNYLLQFITMPDVLGQTLSQATTALALDSITLGSSAVQASSAPAGTVICTDPAPGALFPPTQAVDVGISSGDPGSPPATLCVPPTAPPTSSTAPPPTSPNPPPTSPAEPPPTSPVQPGSP